MRQIKHGDRVRDGIGGEERVPVCRQGERFGIAAAKGLVGQFRGKGIESFDVVVVGVENVDFVTIGQGHKEARIIAGKKQSSRVRATFKRRGGLMKRNEAANGAGLKIELGDGGSVPKGNEAALAIRSHHGRKRQRRRNAMEGGEVEAVNDLAIRCVHQDGFIGTVGSDENTLNAVNHANAQTRRIGDIVEFVATHFAVGNTRAWCDR